MATGLPAGGDGPQLDWPGLAAAAPAPAATPPAPATPPSALPARPAPVASAPPATGPAAPTALGEDGQVVVRPGDTLWALAASRLPAGSPPQRIAQAWPAWWSANRAVIGDDPDLLQPGQRLTPPAAPPAASH